ncbi:hypothetical protein KBG31_01210 [Patescibacteria group bacterium]|nr:hypothetical protein [Patescibacteria group bacterium]
MTLLKNKWQTLIVLIGVFILFKPPIDPDFGWHFKYGEYMVQNRKILRENIFSYTMPDYKWANSYWIPQIIMYSLYSLSETLGLTGDIGMSLVLSAAISVGILVILKKAPLEKWQVVTGAIFLFSYFAKYTISVRPLLFSTIFMLFLIHTILHNTQNIKFLPLLFVIWANSHADFTLGLFVLGIFNIVKLMTQGIKKENLGIHISSLACVAITLVNPYGIFLWETLLKETHPLQFFQIAEWLPLNNKDLLPNFVIAASLILIATIEMKEKKKNLGLIICILFFLILSVRMIYFGRVLILLGIFPVLDFFKNMSPKAKQLLGVRNEKRIAKSVKIAGVVCAIFLVGSFLENIYLASLEERWAKKAGFPYEKVQEIKRLGIEGDMFNEYDWGGYLIWKLPEYKTFVDSRMPSWRDDTGYSAFEEYLEIRKNITQEQGVVEKLIIIKN